MLSGLCLLTGADHHIPRASLFTGSYHRVTYFTWCDYHVTYLPLLTGSATTCHITSSQGLTPYVTYHTDSVSCSRRQLVVGVSYKTGALCYLCLHCLANTSLSQWSHPGIPVALYESAYLFFVFAFVLNPPPCKGHCCGYPLLFPSLLIPSLRFTLRHVLKIIFVLFSRITDRVPLVTTSHISLLTTFSLFSILLLFYCFAREPTISRDRLSPTIMYPYSHITDKLTCTTEIPDLTQSKYQHTIDMLIVRTGSQ